MNAPQPPVVVPLEGPITLPPFPDPGPLGVLGPGVTAHEIIFGPHDPDALPGHTGKLWIFVPNGDHPERSLPCVMLAAYGGNMLNGVMLEAKDIPHCLAYVQAGYVAVAYELDGPLFAPRVAMSSLECPLFLFHARDDGNVPVRDSQKFAAGLRSQGRSVTLEIVRFGDHSGAVDSQGMPRAIEWLRKTFGPDPGG